MTVTYTLAPEVKEIAQKLIANHHSDLIGTRIEYIFRSEAAESNGKTVYGKARKLSGLNAFLATPDRAPVGQPDASTPEVEAFFVLEIAADVWKMIDKKQRAALVDHELCHFYVRPDGALALMPHDVEAFAAEVRRHGLWREDLENSFRSVSGKQLSLLRGDEDE
jgi:hypothetical protein